MPILPGETLPGSETVSQSHCALTGSGAFLDTAGEMRLGSRACQRSEIRCRLIGRKSSCPSAAGGQPLRFSRCGRSSEQLARREPTFCVPLEAEAGTGRTLIAATIHDGSPRSERPFITFDCGAFREHQIDAALFGDERCVLSAL